MEKKKSETTNIFAIMGFIFSLIWPINIAGFIISLVGLSEIKKNNEKGKGLAVAGIVISSIVMLFTILFAILMVLAVIFTASVAIEGTGEFTEAVNANICADYTASDCRLRNDGKYMCDAFICDKSNLAAEKDENNDLKKDDSVVYNREILDGLKSAIN